MAVDFFKISCNRNTNVKIFGICDDQPPDDNPAYLDFDNSDNWIAWIDNNLGKEIVFTTIDHCVEIQRDTGETESSCDGLLQFDTTMIFVELKDRDSGRWLGKARDQLEITIKTYKREVGLGANNRFYAFIANKQRPYFNAANPSIAQEF